MSRPRPAGPASYRDVFAVREYRALFTASGLSLIGDSFSKVALASLMLQATGSVLASAASLAVTFLPWLTGGPFLVALAERKSHRRVMLCCDIGRMVLVSLAAVPGMPIVLLPVVMFGAALLTPPFAASRSALMPLILTGDRYATGLSINSTLTLLTQVGGYAAGGVLAAAGQRVALAVDAATFAVSAMLIAAFIVARPPAASGEQRNLLQETRRGFSVVFGDRALRAIALVVLSASAVAILPEGLAAGWAAELGSGPWAQGLLMATVPAGAMIGNVVIARLVRPAARHHLIRPLALVVPLSLVLVLADPPMPVACVLCVATGAGLALTLPANVLFVRILPEGYRARAFGVMQGGIQLVEGAAIMLGGALVSISDVPHVLGFAGLVGLVVIAAVTSRWPMPGRAAT